MLKRLDKLNNEWKEKSISLLDTQDKLNIKLTKMSELIVDIEVEVLRNPELKNADLRKAEIKKLKNENEDIKLMRNELDQSNYQKAVLDVELKYLDTEMKNIRAVLRSTEGGDSI